jgi:hypothetical protein
MASGARRVGEAASAKRAVRASPWPRIVLVLDHVSGWERVSGSQKSHIGVCAVY